MQHGVKISIFKIKICNLVWYFHTRYHRMWDFTEILEDKKLYNQKKHFEMELSGLHNYKYFCLVTIFSYPLVQSPTVRTFAETGSRILPCDDAWRLVSVIKGGNLLSHGFGIFNTLHSELTHSEQCRLVMNLTLTQIATDTVPWSYLLR